MAHRERLESVNARAQVLLREWVESVAASTVAFEQVDVDQLGEHSDWSRPDLLRWSIELFEALCVEARRSRTDRSSLLIVPLDYSDTLDPVDPDVFEMLAMDWTELVVPGLYLIQDSSVLGWDAPEEYRCLLKSHPVRESSIAYYRCWQTSPSEFARALYFVMHPDLLASS